MWDLIVSFPDHCLSLYLVSLHLCYLNTPSENNMLGQEF